jgi:hypothetical protein
MKVSDILRVKGSTLFTVRPEQICWLRPLTTMAEHDIGSLVVMEHGESGRHADLPGGDSRPRCVKAGGMVGGETVRSRDGRPALDGQFS